MTPYNKKKFLYPFTRLLQHVAKPFFEVEAFHLLFSFTLSTFLTGPHDPKLEEDSVREALNLNRKTSFHTTSILCGFQKHNDDQTLSRTVVLDDRSANCL